MWRKRWKGLAVAGVVLGALVAWSGIGGTAHDFSAASWNTGGELCLPCHTPHNAASDILPLWGHEFTTASFTLYSSDTLDATMLAPGGSSKACLSCHDGTVAVNSFGGTSGADFIGSSAANLSTDLSNDHPISFVYDTALAGIDGSLYDPSIRQVASLDNETIRESMLENHRLECSSCHDVHAGRGDAATADALLVVDNAGSQLCLTCHDK